MPEPTTFPRQSARTQRFSLGAPRSATVTRDGSRVLFLRAASGTDPATGLWCFDVAGGTERLLAGATGGGDLPPEERARRERVRESATGFTGYSTDLDATLAAASLAGRLTLVDLVAGGLRQLATDGTVFDPRLSPDGRHVAYASGGALRVAATDGSSDRVLVSEEGVRWGVAEFVAAEEMGRMRGHWWSPAGDAVLTARVDEAPVRLLHLSDPADPTREPTRLRYPAAGTDNARVSLAVLGLDGSRVDVGWDVDAFPYLARASWSEHGCLLQVQARDQRRVQVLRVDPASGATEVLDDDRDDVWVELVDGAPTWWAGRLVTCADRDGRRRLLVDGEPVTPVTLQVRSVAGVIDDGVLVTASADDPTEVGVWLCSPDRVQRLDEPGGVAAATGAGRTVLLHRAGLDAAASVSTVLVDGQVVGTLRSLVEKPTLTAAPVLRTLGTRDLRAALLRPSSWSAGDPPLPVLLDPYGGPHAQRVLRAQSVFLTSQWFAEQGFAVVVTDGRGTPGRDAAWERAVAGDLASGPLEDQVDALHALAAVEEGLDLGRVAIRGWSFGGYLAALAVLRRPDAVHAAVAGAPVTDWALYDTHYTERYLGRDTGGSPYAGSSLLPLAAGLARPLLLVHGLADDNVLAAHTLRLSTALLEAARPHAVLPLTGVTHLASQEEVAEALLLLQVDFLRRALV